jgi:hypothetical protein
LGAHYVAFESKVDDLVAVSKIPGVYFWVSGWSRQQGNVPPQILDDPDQLPPPAPGQSDLDILVASFSATSSVALSSSVFGVIGRSLCCFRE